MAANNYFGFTHGGTQYRSSSIVLSPQTASTYPTAQTAYVQPTQHTAYATAAPRTAQAYEAYPATAAAATGQYAAYTAAARPQAAAVYATNIGTATQHHTDENRLKTSLQATATYDASKAYYAPAASAQAPTAVYTVTDTPYQTAAKPVYSTTSYSQAITPRQTTAVKAPVSAVSTPYNVYNSGTTSSTQSTNYNTSTTTASTYSGYDAALYSAATSYYQQQQANKTGNTWQAKKTVGIGSTTGGFKPKPKGIPPKPQQLHYCEVCKISCAGPQTYREHLEGQKHKKKEAAAKSGTPTSTSSSTASSAPGRPNANSQLRCELCDVSCTGADAYAAHIRGAKHEKVRSLHTKLGKPIPSTDPVVVGTSSDKAAVAARAAVAKATANSTTTTAKKVVSTPRINFVGGTTLKSGGTKTEEVKQEVKQEVTAAEAAADIIDDKDVLPVGQEYIEEMKNELGKIVSFNCKLCECKFNDPNAKEMHMKGRRHRLQYKKKVDPSLPVDVKPSIKARKVQEERMRKQAAKEEYWFHRSAQARFEHEMYMMHDAPFWGGGYGGPPFRGAPPMRRPDSNDDRHVMAKHDSIYPNESELLAVQNMVSAAEKALKLVSDYIAETDGPVTKVAVKKEADAKETEETKEADQSQRALKGVMRVGVLAKGLLLHGDLSVELILLCAEKPTRTLLVRVADNLPKQLLAVCEEKGGEKYDVKMCVEEASVIITSQSEPITRCQVTLTSPIMRDDPDKDGDGATPPAKDPPDVLDRQKCLKALAALRHAKWFQARANGLQSCVIVIRILRDLCKRVPTWAPLNEWAMELLVEKCVASGGPGVTPGDSLRRVFECIASGILLPGGPGLYDPCEKEPQDCTLTLSPQEREDITASAQHALRLIAFRQVNKVLGIDQLPPPRFSKFARFPGGNRKRRLTSEGGSTEGIDGKKDKKEEEAAK